MRPGELLPSASFRFGDEMIAKDLQGFLFLSFRRVLKICNTISTSKIERLLDEMD